MAGATWTSGSALSLQEKKRFAAVAEEAYQYYQIDESAKEVTREYRLEHEHDNREALRIHVHTLEGLGEGDI